MQLDLTAVLNSMAVGVFVCDGTGALVAVNTAGLRILGAVSLDELRGTVHPFHIPDARLEDGTPIPPGSRPMVRALAGEEVVHELEIFDDETRGTIALRTRTTPLRDAAGAIIGAVKVATDVTRERELARVKDDFIRTAAHELKTPIAVIKANAEAASSAMPHAPGSVPRLLQALIRGVDRIDALINSLLDLLDLQGGLFSFSRLPVRLDQVIVAAISRLPNKAAARVHVTESAAIEVRGDDARLRRAIYSIIDNAIKYSPSSTFVEVSLERDKQVARIAIRDQGFGIPADKQARIFEKFYRAHARTPHDAGGIGVGLYVAREIITQHGGSVRFVSTEHHGTVFYVELPVDRAELG